MPKRSCAPSSGACFSSGSSRLCEMNTRSHGLTSRIPSFRLAMKYASSLPASVSTAMIAPSCTNCSSDFCAHDLLDANGPEDLHRPLGDLCGARMDGRPAMMLDRQRSNAIVTEQQRAGHPDQAAADDQDGNFDVGHGSSRNLTRAGARAAAAFL